MKVERTVRALEPKVRQAVAEAAVIAPGVRSGCSRGGRRLPEGLPAQALTPSLLRRVRSRSSASLLRSGEDRQGIP